MPEDQIIPCFSVNRNGIKNSFIKEAGTFGIGFASKDPAS